MPDIGLSLSVTSSLLGESSYSKSVQWTSYSHKISATAGFDSANFAQDNIGNDEARFWLSSGLGVNVIAKESGQIAWQGFVNQVDLSIGNISLSIGPLVDIANKVAVAYQQTEQDPLGIGYGGENTLTAWAEDTASQSMYGIFETILSGGQGQAGPQEAARDTYLAEFAYPRVSRTISIGEDLSVKVSCLGYYHILEQFIFIDNSNPADYVNASTKIASVMAAEPNGFFSNTSRISTNTLQVAAKTDDSRTGLSTIKDIVALGDSSGNRWLFGVYEDLTPVYEAVPSVAEYVFNAMSILARMKSHTGGHEIPSSLIRPGKWVQITGLLLDSIDIEKVSNRVNPGYEFLEDINYTAPNSFSTSSGTVNTFAQLLAQQGLRSR